MKFLIDRCAGHRLAEWLRAQGHDVVESRERGPDPGDRVLLEWARVEDRILVTMERYERMSSAQAASPMFIEMWVKPAQADGYWHKDRRSSILCLIDDHNFDGGEVKAWDRYSHPN